MNDEVVKEVLPPVQEEQDCRDIFIGGEIDSMSMNQVVHRLRHLAQEPEYPISIFINSCGGDPISAFGVYDIMVALQHMTGVEIQVTVVGSCMSAATLILAGATHRFMTKNSSYMAHQISTSIDSHLQDLKGEVKEMNRLWSQILDIYEAHSNKSKSFWKKRCTKGNFFLNATEALKLGVIDEIL